ncbi:Dynein-1-beta heavy chain, flagellar inner arm I1 complex, partial [Tetrabaena socialis]
MLDLIKPKLVYLDLPLFMALLSDLFPGVELPPADGGVLRRAIEAELREANMQIVPEFVTKITQVFDCKVARHGNMLVGRTGSGKSEAWKCLQRALGRLRKEEPEDDRFQKVHVYTINPLALSNDELYGCFEAATHEWQDGVLARIMRTVCKDESSEQKWILFDGPVDTLWIESMNTTLDDNKLLTLLSAWSPTPASLLLIPHFPHPHPYPRYDESISRKQALEVELSDLEGKLERAEKLVTGLAGERIRWEASISTYEVSLSYLPGDVVVAAAFMSYAGPFPSEYRDELVKHTWLPQVKALNIPASELFDFALFLANPALVRDWNIQGLPSDSFSTENGVMVTRGRRWPLMIDPQGQANKWIKNMEGRTRQLKVLNLQMSDMARQVEIAIQFGLPVLMQDILQEVERYNSLLVTVRRSCVELQRGIRGLVVMSADLDMVFDALYSAKVPAAWLRTYPSLKPLGPWTRDLLTRIEQLATWVEETYPRVYWLSGFTYPTGFLTAVLQTTARKSSVPIDTLSFEFSIINLDEREITAPPKEGVYIKGLFLEGAGWDFENGCLCEPNPMELIVPMPILLFRPVENKKRTAKGVYVCPLYLYPVRTGTRERPSFMINVDLRSGTADPDHWIMRGTA